MQKDRTINVPFSLLQSGTAIATTVPIQPATLGGRVLAIADAYELFKVKKLEFRLLSATTTASASRVSQQVACYLAGVTDTAPGNFALAAEVVEHVALGNAATTPTEWCRVPKSILAGYTPWYKTIAGTPDPSVEVQGNLFIVNPSGTTDTFCAEIRGVISFKGAVPISSTPMLRQLNEMRKEKDRLLKILAVTPAAEKTNQTDPGAPALRRV